MVVATVAFAVPVIAGIVGAGQGGIAGTLLAPKGPRAPQVQPGDILRLALYIQALSESGLKPVVSTDPFTGNTVLSTQDQSGVLQTLLGEKFAREALAATPEEIQSVRDLQSEAIRLGRAGLLPEVGAPVLGQIAPTVRDEVVANLTTVSARVVAPGVVARRGRDLTEPKELGGPCAVANTGFSRLNCARGGFA